MDELKTIRLLHERLAWVVPVGKHRPTGYMVCRRYLINCDGPSSVVEYMRKDGVWERPFKEDCVFCNYEEALNAAVRFLLPNTLGSTPEPKCGEHPNWVHRIIGRVRCVFGRHALKIERPLTVQSDICKCQHCGKRWVLYLDVDPNQCQLLPWTLVKPFYDRFSGTIRDGSSLPDV